MDDLSERARTKPSPTIALAARVGRMISDGEEVVPFMVGEPDFDTPEYIKAAAAAAIQQGCAKYTGGEGLPGLREAISDNFLSRDRLAIPPENIVVTAGGKYALALSFMAICSGGDEVLIPSPYYVSFVDLVRLAGATPVIVQTAEKDGFRLSPESIERSITPRTKALVLNSPSNPAGFVYRQDELEKIAGILSGRGVYVVSDEVYDTIVFDGRRHVSIASAGIPEKTVIIRSFSKTYSMCGWRVGYAAGPPAVVRAITNMQSQMIAHPDNIAQKAAIAALRGPQEEMESMREEFEARRDLIVELAGNLKGVSFVRPEGAFYLFLNVGSVYGRKKDGKTVGGSIDFAESLLDGKKVAVAPGAQFGADEYIRISYATSRENIVRGMERIGGFLSAFTG